MLRYLEETRVVSDLVLFIRKGTIFPGAGEVQGYVKRNYGRPWRCLSVGY